MTTLLVLLVVWLAISPVLAFACAAFIRAGKGPRAGVRPRLLPGLEGGGNTERGPRAGISRHYDLAA
jgi:hypothetical protein